MIKSNRKALPLWFFTSYFRLLQKLLFRKVTFVVENSIPDGPVLLLQNHFSWWDGYWSYYIAEKLLSRKFHVMMLEKELRKRMFLTRTGAFSVDPDGKGVVSSLRYAADLLSDSSKLVALYPQGKIESHFLSSIEFKPGAESLLRLSPSNVQVIFAAAHIHYGAPARPEAFIYIRHIALTPASTLQEAYNHFYRETRNFVIEKSKSDEA